MHMSKAALPPIQPAIREADRAHPLFAEYMRVRASHSAQLITSPSFAHWLYQREAQAIRDGAADHPDYPAFLRWMRATNGRRGKCPAGDEFPLNFRHWLAGGRW